MAIHFNDKNPETLYIINLMCKFSGGMSFWSPDTPLPSIGTKNLAGRKDTSALSHPTSRCFPIPFSHAGLRMKELNRSRTGRRGVYPDEVGTPPA
jgi:hypothetical protein